MCMMTCDNVNGTFVESRNITIRLKWNLQRKTDTL